MDTLTPSQKRARNNCGLLEHLKYEFYDDGLVNWRAMIPKEFLVLNLQNKDRLEKKYNKKIEEIDVVGDNVDDSDLIILLGGIKHLASVRGYKSVEYRPIVASQEYVATVCKISWIPNYETNYESVSFESMAGASLQTTNGFGQKYLSEMSENRSFCRAVRNFLRVNIVSKEEISGSERTEEPQNTNVGLDPISIFAKIMSERQIPFSKIKGKLIERGVDGAEAFNSINDVPKSIIIEYIEKLKTKAKAETV